MAHLNPHIVRRTSIEGLATSGAPRGGLAGSGPPKNVAEVRKFPENIYVLSLPVNTTIRFKRLISFLVVSIISYLAKTFKCRKLGSTILLETDLFFGFLALWFLG